MVKGLIFHSWSLFSAFMKATHSIRNLTTLLNKNGYSKSMFERLTKKTIDKIIKNKTIDFNITNEDSSLDDLNLNNNNIQNNGDNNINKLQYCMILLDSEGYKILNVIFYKQLKIFQILKLYHNCIKL